MEIVHPLDTLHASLLAAYPEAAVRWIAHPVHRALALDDGQVTVEITLPADDTASGLSLMLATAHHAQRLRWPAVFATVSRRIDQLREQERDALR